MKDYYGFFRRLARCSSVRRASRSHHQYRPRVERLEDRVVPSGPQAEAWLWVHKGGDDLWSDWRNWINVGSEAPASVPENGDLVYFGGKWKAGKYTGAKNGKSVDDLPLKNIWLNVDSSYGGSISLNQTLTLAGGYWKSTGTLQSGTSGSQTVTLNGGSRVFPNVFIWSAGTFQRIMFLVQANAKLELAGSGVNSDPTLDKATIATAASGSSLLDLESGILYFAHNSTIINKGLAYASSNASGFKTRSSVNNLDRSRISNYDMLKIYAGNFEIDVYLINNDAATFYVGGLVTLFGGGAFSGIVQLDRSRTLGFSIGTGATKNMVYTWSKLTFTGTGNVELLGEYTAGHRVDAEIVVATDVLFGDNDPNDVNLNATGGEIDGPATVRLVDADSNFNGLVISGGNLYANYSFVNFSVGTYGNQVLDPEIINKSVFKATGESFVTIAGINSWATRDPGAFFLTSGSTINLVGGSTLRLNSSVAIINDMPPVGAQITGDGTAWIITGVASGRSLIDQRIGLKLFGGKYLALSFSSLWHGNDLLAAGILPRIGFLGTAQGVGGVELSAVDDEPDSLNMPAGSFARGTGTIQVASTVNDGILHPSRTPNWIGTNGGPGELYFVDNLTDLSGAETDIVVEGTTPVSAFSQIEVDGFAQLAGSLDILLSAFTPAPGETFKVLNLPGGYYGTFATVDDPTFTSGGISYTFQVLYDPTDVTLAVVAASGAAPALSALSSNSGSTAGGTTLTISGTNLGDTTAVQFDSIPAESWSYNSSTGQITAVAPAHAYTGSSPISLSLTNTQGSASTSYYYNTEPAAPAVSGLSVSSDYTPGGETVTITGTNLAGASAVSFGANAATFFAVQSATSIVAIDPASSSTGTVDVTVTTPSGSSSTSSSDEFTYDAVPVPTVSSVSPTSGAGSGGTTITITGTGFTLADEVDFGGATVFNFTINSDTSITVVSAPAVAGTVDVTVDTSAGASALSSSDRYTTTAGSAPSVTSLGTSSGSTAGGTVVTISGSGFTGSSEVYFGSMPATYFAVNSDAQITAQAPAQAAGTVDVTVVTPSGTSATSSSDQFTYSTGSAPTVSSVSPNSGSPNGGNQITIIGSGFTDALSVSFGTVAAGAFTVLNDSTIVVTVPAEAAGTVDISVTNNSGTSSTSSSDHYTYSSGTAPSVTGVTPGSGGATGGALVLIAGSGFSGASAVNFGSNSAPWFTVLADYAIEAVAPAGAGTVDITVSTPAGTSSTGSADHFTYTTVSAPSISSLSSSSGSAAGGLYLTVTGSGFTGATDISIGSVSVTQFTVNSDTQITLLTPAAPAGVADIQVVTGAGTSAAVSADRFTYTLASLPSVSSLGTTSGSTAGGTTVTISGSNFSGLSDVFFGNVEATSFTLNSSTSITAYSPSQAAGTVDVRVVTTAGYSAPGSSDDFTYSAASGPSVTSLGTTTGSSAGGTTVVIQGSGFLGSTAVNFGSVAASFIVLSDSAIQATSPSQAAGTVDVTVTTPSSTSSTGSSDHFTYSAASTPVVSSLSITSGNTTGPDPIVLSGSYFTGASQVAFGSNVVGFQVNSDSSITVYPPYLAAGTYTVYVTTPSGTSSSGGPTFTYDNVSGSAPTVTGVSPNSGTDAGGQWITVTGTNFYGTTGVAFSGVAAEAYTIVSGTQLSVETPDPGGTEANVRVTTNNGTSAITSADEYLQTTSPAPAVSSLGTTSGSTAGGTSVTITGTTLSGATAVMFGSEAAASFTVNSSTSITAVSPAAYAGTVDITVTTANGLSATGSGDQFTYTTGSLPTVSSLGTSTGTTAGGTSVTLTGTNLGDTVGVYFGGMAAASFTVNSSTSVTAISPAQYAGTYDVTVSNHAGTSVPTSSDEFAYTLGSAPTVSSLSTSSGNTGGSTTTTITGTNLLGTSAVMFGTVPAASFTVNSSTSITAVSPPQAAGTVDVTVTTYGGTSASSSSDHFTYSNASAPTVSGVSPTSGTTGGGTTVTITGTNLLGTTAVNFGTVAAASFTINSSTSITAVSPPEASGTVDITVTTYSATSSTGSSDHYTFSAASAPSVSSIAPSSGSTLGGTLVTILGSYFTGASTVDFGSVAASFTVISDNAILATAPAESAGNVYITVITPTGTSSTGSSSEFTYSAPSAPTISSLSTSSGTTAGGTTVTITGTNLANVDTVLFGGVAAASFLDVNGTTITAVSPPDTAGTIEVTVSAQGTASALNSSDRYTFTAASAPAVSSLSTSSGSTAGGTSITITGTNLTGTSYVAFGGVPAASFTVVSSTSITAVSPSEVAGTVDVTVTTLTGTSATSSSDQFTFSTGTSPSVTALSITSGGTGGGTVVSISGSAFTNATGVSFGTEAAAFSVMSDGWIVATAPSQSSGTVDVTVTTNSGTSSTSSADHFTYSSASAPSVSAITESSGNISGGGVVIITGSGFTASSAVNFGSTAATDFTVISDSAIMATAPAESAGTVDITVTTPSGTSSTSSADQYTFSTDSAPTVTSLNTTSGSTAGGAAVIITGTNFNNVSSVMFGSYAATAFYVNSATQITAVAPPQAAGTVDITVTNDDATSATSSSDQFTYSAASTPTVSSVSLTWGDIGGGSWVTVNGSNFDGAESVYFGSTPASSFTVLSNSVLVAQAPAAGSTGTVDITVQTYAGTSSTGSGDQFFYDAAPTAADDSYTATENTELTVTNPGVLNNDSDPAGLTMSAVLVSGPGDGTLSLNSGGGFSYTPNTGFTGTDTFTYYANDGYENSNVATVTITVGSPMLAEVQQSIHEGHEEHQGNQAITALTQAELQPIVAAAISRWQAVLGANSPAVAAMKAEPIVIEAMSSGYLGLTTAQEILISPNASGYGWFVDPTPATNQGFTPVSYNTLEALPNEAAVGEMDLLTVVMHELGHLAGYQDDHGHDIMQQTLALGTRIVPVGQAGGGAAVDRSANGMTASSSVFASAPDAELVFGQPAGALSSQGAPAGSAAPLPGQHPMTPISKTGSPGSSAAGVADGTAAAAGGGGVDDGVSAMAVNGWDAGAIPVEDAFWVRLGQNRA